MDNAKKKFPGRALKSYSGWMMCRTSFDDTPPVDNHEFMKRVMCYLPTPDLLNCRGVCKSWSTTATNEIAKTSVAFFEHDDFEDPLIGLQPFVYAMARLSLPLIQRIHLLDLDLDHPLVTTFFQMYGRHIRELRIETTAPERSRSMHRSRHNFRLNYTNEPPPVKDITIKDLRNLIMFYVPNLEYLELVDLPIHIRTEPLFLDWYIEESQQLLSKSEDGLKSIGISPSNRSLVCNLKRLRVKPGGNTPRKWRLIDDLIWASDNLTEVHIGSGVFPSPIIECLEQYGRFSKLKCLVLASFTLSDLRLLVGAVKFHQLQLVHFQCRPSIETSDSLVGSQMFRSIFEEFLNGQKDSLKILRLNEDSTCPFNINLDEMPQLKELKMIPVNCSIPSFLDFAPFLKVLSLSGLCGEIGEFVWDSMFPQTISEDYLATVAELELPIGFKQAVRLKSIVRYFPNVVTLTAKGLDEATVLISLWTAWPLLESLALELAENWKENTDRIFTGVSPQIFESVAKSVRKTLQAQHSLLEFPKINSIANLEKLRHLEITLSSDLKDYRYSFTNITGYFALMRMHKLKTLLLPVSNIDEICISYLVSRLNLERYDFENLHGGSRWWRN